MLRCLCGGILGASLHPGIHHHLSSAGKLDRIAQQVGKHLRSGMAGGAAQAGGALQPVARCLQHAQPIEMQLGDGRTATAKLGGPPQMCPPGGCEPSHPAGGGRFPGPDPGSRPAPGLQVVPVMAAMRGSAAQKQPYVSEATCPPLICTRRHLPVIPTHNHAPWLSPQPTYPCGAHPRPPSRSRPPPCRAAPAGRAPAPCCCGQSARAGRLEGGSGRALLLHFARQSYCSRPAILLQSAGRCGTCSYGLGCPAAKHQQPTFQ